MPSSRSVEETFPSTSASSRVPLEISSITSNWTKTTSTRLSGYGYCRRFGGSTKGVKILDESPLMFEVIRWFLEALSKLSRRIYSFLVTLILQPSRCLASCVLAAPRYARLPHFQLCLDSLFPEDAGVWNLMLFVADALWIGHARKILRDPVLPKSCRFCYRHFNARRSVDTRVMYSYLSFGPFFI